MTHNYNRTTHARARLITQISSPQHLHIRETHAPQRRGNVEGPESVNPFIVPRVYSKY